VIGERRPTGRPSRRDEQARIFAAITLATVGILAFLAIAWAMSAGHTAGFDRTIVLALRSSVDLADPLGPEWLEIAIRDVTALGGYPILILAGALVIGFLLVTGARGAAALVLVSLAGGILIGTGLKDVFERPRPDLVPPLVAVATSSFPSGHAMLSTVVWLTLGLVLASLLPRSTARTFVLSTACAFALIVGASRVYLGVHWPTDVLAGWCVGMAWAMICWLAGALLRRRERPDAFERSGDRVEDGAGR
jgi:undecaprenyl-diphosphatase